MAEVSIPVQVRLDEVGTILRQKREIERLEAVVEAAQALSGALHEARMGAQPIDLPVGVVAAWQVLDEYVAALGEVPTA